MDDLQIIRELTEHGQWLKNHDHEIRDLKTRQENVDGMIQAITTLKIEQDGIKGDVKEIKDDVKTLKDKPGRRWETIISAVISAIIGGVIGYLLFRLGLGG